MEIMKSIEDHQPSQSVVEINGQEKTKKGHPKLNKAQKLKFTISAILIGISVIYFVAASIWSGSGGNLNTSDSSRVVTSIPTTKGEVSDTQIKRIEQSKKQDLVALNSGENVTTASGLFDLTVKPTEPVKSDSNAVAMTGVSASDRKTQSPEEQAKVTKTESSFGERFNGDDRTPDQSQGKKQPTNTSTKVNKPDRGGSSFGSVGANSSNKRQSANNDPKAKRIQEILKKREITSSSSNGQSSRSPNQVANNHMYTAQAAVTTTSNKGSTTVSNSGKSKSTGFDFDLSDKAFEDVSTSDNDSTNVNNSSKEQGTGRGYIVGDVILAETQNGLKSTSPSKYLIVRALQGPLKGARMVFTPTVSYDTYVYESNELYLPGEGKSKFKAIIVTPNTTLQTGFRSDVDYHTLYKLGMLWVYGSAKGAAALVNAASTTISASDSTTVYSSNYGTKELLIAGAGGVADAATDLMKDEISKPPTVTVDAKEVIGIMFVEEFNPPWLPVVAENEYTVN
jgi:hypothetical protein